VITNGVGGGLILCVDPLSDKTSQNVKHTLRIEHRYCADLAPWSELLPLLNDSWFIDCPVDEAMRRVTERHISTGKDPEIARKRVATNDRPNAELIHESRGQASLIVPSLPLLEGLEQL